MGSKRRRPVGQCIMVSGGRGVRPMSQTTARGIAYTRVLSEARKQLNMGTEVEALIDAAGDLREFDSNDPLITALEARIRRAAQIGLWLFGQSLLNVVKLLGATVDLGPGRRKAGLRLAGRSLSRHSTPAQRARRDQARSGLRVARLPLRVFAAQRVDRCTGNCLCMGLRSVLRHCSAAGSVSV